MFDFPNIRLLTFSKSPEPGKVKTRMQPVLSPDFSVELQQQLINYCLPLWHTANICSVDLWLSGDISVFKEKCPTVPVLNMYKQQGVDLGERMYFAAKQALNGNDKSQAVILVGTDCPFIDKEYLLNACESLQTHDVVISPAVDGGYVLLGFKQLSPELFDNIHWGSSQVFQQTLEAINRIGLSCQQLPVLSDIDRPEDLAVLADINAFQSLLSRWNIQAG